MPATGQDQSVSIAIQIASKRPSNLDRMLR
jgi:hypothetical protein